MQSGNSTQPPFQLSSRIQAKIKEAELYLGQGLFEEARQIYQELLDKLGAAPGESVAVFRRFLQEKQAVISREEEKFRGTSLPPEAAPDEEVPEAAEESEGQSHFERGRKLLSERQFAEAIEEFRSAAELGCQAAECALHRAKSYQELGRHQDAIKVLQESLSLPELDGSQRSRLLEQLAVAKEAAREKEEFVEPEDSPVVPPSPHPTPPPPPVRGQEEETLRHGLHEAKLHLKNKQFLEGIHQLRQLRRRGPVPVPELITIYEEILRKDSKNLEALKDLAEISIAEDTLTQAATYLERMQEIAPHDLWSRNQLIYVYRQLLETEQASLETRLKLARHLLRADRVEAAVDQYVEVILAETCERLPTLLELGEVLLERQDYDRIVELLGHGFQEVDSGREGPEVLRYYTILARAYEKKDLPEQAREWYRRAAAIDPQHQALRDKVAVHDTGLLVSRVKSFLGSQPATARQYRIEAKLAEDEALELFRVREAPHGEIRIAKTLLPQIADRDRVKEFIRLWSYEQVTMENRNLVRILDVAECKGRYYFITEAYDTTLADFLAEKGSLSLSAAVRLAREMLNALAYAHSHRGTDDTLRKIFHLCLSPRRVYIKDDLTRARIADLGLTYLLDTVLDWHPAYTERSAEDLAYQAPEQFDRLPGKMPNKMKQAVDIYAFGVVLYQMLTGHIPFTGPSPEDFCKQHNEKYPVPPRVFISTIPANLDDLILKCLQKDPKKRWRTPTEIDLVLEKINL